MIQYIVIVNNDLMQYVDRYRVYNDFDAAMKWASGNGYENMLGTNKKVGMLNMYNCGDVDVSIMAVESRNE